jgi:hypothetical protein
MLQGSRNSSFKVTRFVSMTPSAHEMDAGEQHAMVVKQRFDLVLPFFLEQLSMCFRETEIVMRVMTVS